MLEVKMIFFKIENRICDLIFAKNFYLPSSIIHSVNGWMAKLEFA